MPATGACVAVVKQLTNRSPYGSCSVAFVKHLGLDEDGSARETQHEIYRVGGVDAEIPLA